MPRFPFVRQKDAMQCGAACLSSICRHYGKPYSTRFISRFCQETATGVSLRALSMAAEHLGFDTMCVKIQKSAINDCDLPCILHWNQNHFVVLYKTDSARHKYYISDPGKGLICADDKEFDEAWLSASGIGIALLLEPNGRFGKLGGEESADSHSLTFIFRYMKEYRGYLVQIFLGLLFGCLLQLILPFLTQSIVDIGIGRRDIGFIWLILLGELMIVFGKTATDFIRRWLLLHISMRVNISLVSDFFIKLLKLPMSFFDSKLMGDLLQRVGDHGRVQSFLTGQTLNVVFTFLSFVIFGAVLLVYSRTIFCIFLLGSIVYGGWIALFLHKRKILDYELFEQEAVNQSRTYQFLTSIQEIKLQNCEKRRRWEWEDTQANLFAVRTNL